MGATSQIILTNTKRHKRPGHGSSRVQYSHVWQRFPLFLFCCPFLISSHSGYPPSLLRPTHCPSHFTLSVSLPLFHAFTLLPPLFSLPFLWLSLPPPRLSVLSNMLQNLPLPSPRLSVHGQQSVVCVRSHRDESVCVPVCARVTMWVCMCCSVKARGAEGALRESEETRWGADWTWPCGWCFGTGAVADLQECVGVHACVWRGVCVRWDPLWAEDKQLRERTGKLKKPGKPNSIVRYPNLFSSFLFYFIILSCLDVACPFFPTSGSVYATLITSQLFTNTPPARPCLPVSPPQPPTPHSSLWLSFCCYALLRVGSVRSWCSLDETLRQNANIPLRAGSLPRHVSVCVCVCLMCLRMCGCFRLPLAWANARALPLVVWVSRENICVLVCACVGDKYSRLCAHPRAKFSPHTRRWMFASKTALQVSDACASLLSCWCSLTEMAPAPLCVRDCETSKTWKLKESSGAFSKQPLTVFSANVGWESHSCQSSAGQLFALQATWPESLPKLAG